MAKKLSSKTAKAHIQERLYWGKQNVKLPDLDLTKVQRDSYQEFLTTGIGEALQEMNPISDFTGKNWELTLGKYTFGKPKHNPEQALLKGLSYETPLRVEVSLLNKQTGKVTKQEVFLGDIPRMKIVRAERELAIDSRNAGWSSQYPLVEQYV